jgi:hypothetical protein
LQAWWKVEQSTYISGNGIYWINVGIICREEGVKKRTLAGPFFIYNLKVDREEAEKRQELEAKAPKIPEDLPEKVRSMKAQSQEIQAIKLVREQTGMSLYDAKNYVDSIDA